MPSSLRVRQAEPEAPKALIRDRWPLSGQRWAVGEQSTFCERDDGLAYDGLACLLSLADA